MPQRGRSSSSVRWCCPGFEAHFHEAGHRGLAIVVAPNETGDGPRFLFQHRAVDQGAGFQYDGKVAITLISEGQIGFCPWCGKSLTKWYRRKWKELLRPEVELLDLT